jgi:hypothetical protein
VALPVSQEDPSAGSGSSSGVNTMTVVFSVIGAVLVVTIIVSATICILNKRNSSRRPRTAFKKNRKNRSKSYF